MKAKRILSLAISAAMAASSFCGLCVTASAEGEYTASIGTITGGAAGDVMLVDPNATPVPTDEPPAEVTELVPITEDYAFIADSFTANGTTAIGAGTYFDGGKVYSELGNNPASNKQKSVINGEEHLNSLRLKGAQNYLEFIAGVDAEITVYSNIQNQSGKERAVAAGTTAGGTELGHGEVEDGFYTFRVSAGTKVYLTGVNASDWATGGDMYIAGFTVTPLMSAASVTASENEFLAETIKAAAGSTVTVKAEDKAMHDLTITTDPSAEVTVAGGGYYTFTMPASDITVNAEYVKNESKMPDDVIWRADDAAFDSAFGAAEPVTVSGLTVSAGITSNNKKVLYTHTDGTEYEFTRQWKHGASENTLTFTPMQACIVTVVFNGNGNVGREVNISQNGVIIAAASSTDTSTSAAEIVQADVEDPTLGDVVISGGGSNKNISAIFVEYYDPTTIVTRSITGNVTHVGTMDISNVKLVFTDTKDGTRYETAAAGSYSVELRQNRSYNITAEENGAVSERIAVSLLTNSLSVAKSDAVMDITIADIAPAEVTGDVVVHDVFNDGVSLDLSKVTLTFTADDDASLVYTAGIADNKIAVTLMPNHTYTVTASGIDGYALSPLSSSYVMAAGDTAPFKNILFTETVSDVEFKSEVRVGADKEFKRINDAVTAIKAMVAGPAGEDGRVTILVDPGVYTEQVILDSDYITLKAADENNRPEIQWYYGIGYLYYSSAGNQYYSEDYATAKVKKGTVTRWGAACRITGSYVNLESIIIRNTFNCFVSEAELADGVAPALNNEYSDTNGKPDRTTEGYDAMTQTAVERAAAIALDGAYSEVYKCDFISSQDTFYTNNTAYVKDCYIEGGTDYIYGGNSVVFDGCTLAWHGYSDAAKGGYVTANKNAAAPAAGVPNPSANGYLLKNCTITNSKYYPDNLFAAGGWGRNWGGAECQVIFDGVTIDGAAAPTGWTNMGKGTLGDSVLYVNNVTGADADLSAANPNGTMEANGYTMLEDYQYFNGWQPPHYEGTVPDVPSQPTQDPGEPAGMISCVKVTAVYADSGALKSVSAEPVTIYAADAVMTVNGNVKTMYWESLESMKPAGAPAESDEPSKPEETADPAAESNIIWKAADVSYEAGQDLGGGLSLVFGTDDTSKPVYTAFVTSSDDPTPKNKIIGGAAFSGYVSSGANGNWSGTSIDPASLTALKYEAEKDGILTVYLDNVGEDKKICAGQDGMKKADIEAASVLGTGESMAVETVVNAGNAYYIYIAGSKGRFCGAAFREAAVAQSWSASESDIGKTAGAELMPGLTLVSDNTSTSGKYVTTSNGNPKWEDGVLTGSALKYAAAANGTLSVTFSDLGNVDQQKTAVITDAEGNVITSRTTEGLAKETFDLSTEVTAGNTYYIYGQGTSARYSAASFTPAN